jgi:lipopolysaccharide export system protein LptA
LIKFFHYLTILPFNYLLKPIIFARMKKHLLKILMICFLTFGASAQEFAHDDQLPVEITSDKLEVFQAEKKALFSGNVKATQGDVKIDSKQMQVFYSMDKDRFGRTQNAVSKVEANGDVFLSTPKEKAKGDNAVFDVSKKIITLLGNVELMSGKNLVKGDKFVYNLNTGKSEIVGGNTVIEKDKNNKQRVRGVFTPEG